MALASFTMSRKQARLHSPIRADGPSKGIHTLRKYFHKQLSTLHNYKKNVQQQPSVDYTSAEVYSATYKRLEVVQRMYWHCCCSLSYSVVPKLYVVSAVVSFDFVFVFRL